jgi:hypothetical protein
MRRDEIWRWMLRVVVTGSLLRMTPGAIGMMGIRKKAKTGGADCENGVGFWCCTKSYKLVELYEIVQGEENEGKRVCGADRGCGGI